MLAVAYLWVDGDVSKITKVITFENLKKAYLYVVINGALIITLNNLIFRNVFGYITILISMLFYVAIVKYFTGNILLFYEFKLKKDDFSYLIFFVVYLSVIYYIGLMRLGRLASAVVYRTTNS